MVNVGTGGCLGPGVKGSGWELGDLGQVSCNWGAFLGKEGSGLETPTPQCDGFSHPESPESRVSAPTHSSQQAKRPGGGGRSGRKRSRRWGLSTSSLLSSWETSGPSSSGWNSLPGCSLQPVPCSSVTDCPLPLTWPHPSCTPLSPPAGLSPLPGLGKRCPGRLPGVSYTSQCLCSPTPITQS